MGCEQSAISFFLFAYTSHTYGFIGRDFANLFLKFCGLKYFMIKSLSFDNIVHIIPQDLWEVSANVNKYIVLFATHYFTNYSYVFPNLSHH